MLGDREIIEMRKAGYRPDAVYLMTTRKPYVVGEVLIEARDTRPDLRFLVGLDVTLIVEAWSAATAALWERIKAARPAFAVLAVLSWGEDVGLKWMPGRNDTPIGEAWNGELSA